MTYQEVKIKMDERIKNIKIAVHNEEESKAVQEKLFELGAYWYDDNFYKDSNYLFISCTGKVTFEYNNKRWYDNKPNKEIYVEDLLAMEVEKDESLIDKCIMLDHFSKPYGDYCKKEDILEIKQKILEDIKELVMYNYHNEIDLHHDDEIQQFEEILDKRIGEDK